MAEPEITYSLIDPLLNSALKSNSRMDDSNLIDFNKELFQSELPSMLENSPPQNHKTPFNYQVKETVETVIPYESSDYKTPTP